VNYDNSLVVTITVTCNLWAPSCGDHLFYMWSYLPAATSASVGLLWSDTCKYHKITKIANITKISKTRLVRPQLLRSLRLVRSLILLRLISDLHILDHLSNHGDLGDLSNLKNLRDLVLLKKVQLYKSKISNNSKTWPHWEILTTVLKSAPQNCLEKFLNPNPHKIHLKFLCCVIN